MDNQIDMDSKKTPFGEYLSTIKDYENTLISRSVITKRKLENLCNNFNANLYADEFYKIIITLDQDIDEACEKVFGKLKFPEIKEVLEFDEKLTAFGNYVRKFLTEQKDLAEKLGINTSRFSKLNNDFGKTPYAAEVYSLAIYNKEKPSDAFKTLYDKSSGKYL